MIVDPILLLAFVPAGLALNLTPGPDMMFCLAQGLRGGARCGWAASTGVALGGMVHVLLAGLGLGALVAALPGAFDVIRWGGAAYLAWIAWKTLRTPIAGSDAPALTPSRAMRQGFVVNITNPKFILFVLAFVPQFIDPALPVLPQFLIYGLLMSAGGVVINGLVGQFSGAMRRHLRGGSRTERGLRYACATLFGGLALRLAA
ncbi:LysE family translocator [Mameliella sediminis]|uniref:LysE family translocator n=1 Tax=Mameliella sediminis TaxID=2836866 RepID=UPI001C47A647|nr:LysE family translocator [Mameliella sediminis]MBY6113429.1 LysE family translocator [Antarctobacter heliothermus]MBY6143223.1 LysE family translocator [Mameliella alba]MBV7394727.1 LysE family translocator [Mameliella sediminis]MBY6163176.1 LysE family translocator [Mameliella alba]MBY6171440.1 LysE family translocator [Mameliella alba]